MWCLQFHLLHLSLFPVGRRHDEDGIPARTKLWDACLYSGFAATAGGGNPRHLRAERLRNRFDKKFSYFPQVWIDMPVTAAGAVPRPA